MKKILIVVLLLIIAGAMVYFSFNGRMSPGASTPETPAISPAQGIGIRQIAQGFVSPVLLVSARDSSGRLFVVDQVGVIKIIDASGNVMPENFLDIKSRIVPLSANYDERGLLGLAFHPDFKNNGRFFVHYSAPPRTSAPAGWNCTETLSEFKLASGNVNAADPASEKIILQIDHPQANHNGGHIAFGPDGYLYVPMGDGGQANDAGLGHSATGNGQDLATLLGKIIRIDIDNGNPYSIPPDNPFVGKSGRPEIFAYGFRNPYHISFDAGGDRELFAADVGQGKWEEVDIVAKGNNYGWNIKEGRHCLDPQNVGEALVTCASEGAQGEPLVDPILEYGHPDNGGPGIAIVGGYVYRGSALTELAGKYIFADWSKSFTNGAGTVFAATGKDNNWDFSELKISGKAVGRIGLFIKGVGQDDSNELYLLTAETSGPTGTTGKVFKIIP
ncbi:MAG: PQQ-dependent sugar dehydrogenase [Candidatus Pacebacteria bacterium]|jgi:glucose/arabinose dehydrogenase|nr:PQQ-dependent sugar dehydrogenase [Candidatus Paceibacterota bacterium]